MNNHKYLTGSLFIIAGLLNFTRMIPFNAGNSSADSLPDFPLKNASEIATFVSSNYSGHVISHVMALISFPLILIGLFHLYTIYKENHATGSNVFMIGGLFGTLLFSVAVILDGFVMSFAVEQFLGSGESGTSAMAALVEISHHAAIQFFSVALVFLTLMMFVLSLVIRSGKHISSWIGWAGIFFGAAGLLGYSTGAFGYNWENFPLSGLAIMSIYVWIILLGIGAFRMDKRVVVLMEEQAK